MRSYHEQKEYLKTIGYLSKRLSFIKRWLP